MDAKHLFSWGGKKQGGRNADMRGPHMKALGIAASWRREKWSRRDVTVGSSPLAPGWHPHAGNGQKDRMIEETRDDCKLIMGLNATLGMTWGASEGGREVGTLGKRRGDRHFQFVKEERNTRGRAKLWGPFPQKKKNE